MNHQISQNTEADGRMTPVMKNCTSSGITTTSFKSRSRGIIIGTCLWRASRECFLLGKWYSTKVWRRAGWFVLPSTLVSAPQANGSLGTRDVCFSFCLMPGVSSLVISIGVWSLFHSDSLEPAAGRILQSTSASRPTGMPLNQYYLHGQASNSIE